MNDAYTNQRPNAWGRWGTDDEAGALNHIGVAQVQRAAALVRTGQVIRLAQPLSRHTPVPAHRTGLQHFMGRDGGDYAAGAGRPGGFQFAEDTVVMPLHIGTHIDALCHAWCDGDCSTITVKARYAARQVRHDWALTKCRQRSRVAY